VNQDSSASRFYEGSPSDTAILLLSRVDIDMYFPKRVSMGVSALKQSLRYRRARGDRRARPYPLTASGARQAWSVAVHFEWLCARILPWLKTLTAREVEPGGAWTRVQVGDAANVRKTRCFTLGQTSWGFMFWRNLDGRGMAISTLRCHPLGRLLPHHSIARWVAVGNSSFSRKPLGRSRTQRHTTTNAATCGDGRLLN